MIRENAEYTENTDLPTISALIGLVGELSYLTYIPDTNIVDIPVNSKRVESKKQTLLELLSKVQCIWNTKNSEWVYYNYVTLILSSAQYLCGKYEDSYQTIMQFNNNLPIEDCRELYKLLKWCLCFVGNPEKHRNEKIDFIDGFFREVSQNIISQYIVSFLKNDNILYYKQELLEQLSLLRYLCSSNSRELLFGDIISAIIGTYVIRIQQIKDNKP